MVSDKRDSNYDTTTHKTKVAQVKSNDDVLDKGVKERSDIDHDLYTGRQKVIHKEISRRDTTEFDSNSEARIRAQTLDGSRKANTPGSKYKRVNSEEGNVGLQSNLAPTREMPSPVHEISPVSRVKEAFVYMTDEDEKQQADSEKIKRDHSNSGKPYARQIPYAGTGRKISKFYKKKSKDVKKW